MAKDTNPVPTPEEKAALSDGLLERMKAVNEAEAALVDLKNAVNAQFAEVGNSDKMEYTDRDTGQVRKWGISEAKMAQFKAAEADAAARVKAALQI